MGVFRKVCLEAAEEGKSPHAPAPTCACALTHTQTQGELVAGNGDRYVGRCVCVSERRGWVKRSTGRAVCERAEGWEL